MFFRSSAVVAPPLNALSPTLKMILSSLFSMSGFSAYTMTSELAEPDIFNFTSPKLKS